MESDSQAENMIQDADANMGIRRSQRLLEKRKIAQTTSGVVNLNQNIQQLNIFPKNTTRSKRGRPKTIPTTQSLFSPTEIREDEESYAPFNLKQNSVTSLKTDELSSRDKTVQTKQGGKSTVTCRRRIGYTIGGTSVNVTNTSTEKNSYSIEETQLIKPNGKLKIENPEQSDNVSEELSVIKTEKNSAQKPGISTSFCAKKEEESTIITEKRKGRKVQAKREPNFHQKLNNVPLDLLDKKSKESLLKTSGVACETSKPPLASSRRNIKRTNENINPKSGTVDTEKLPCKYLKKEEKPPMDVLIKAEDLSGINISNCSLPPTKLLKTSPKNKQKRSKRGNRPPKSQTKNSEETKQTTYKNYSLKNEYPRFMHLQPKTLTSFYQPNFKYELPPEALLNQGNRVFSQPSMLPHIYPPHFKHQLPPEAIHNQTFLIQPPNIITPEETQTLDVQDSSSMSSPSLTESLRGILNTDDIKQTKKPRYRLYDYHIDALAVTLNLPVNYLRNLLEKIITMSPNALQKISAALSKPFVKDHDLFERDTPPSNCSSENEVILSSQKEN
ncbi:meiotic P22 [Musca autumnalis]|uniref:meiotic P22 n=1 Tax=Musca autumnalis TaxID=221902 RepID=UPI003CED46EC